MITQGTPEILRGVARAFALADQAVVTELTLADGRRADLVALDRAGTITLVEVKASRADFRADRKWQAYLAWCDRFYFAVADGFPLELLPPEEGVIRADRFTAEILREPRPRALAAARRKALLIRIGRVSAVRLQALIDPPL
jgi:hypothetical protein